VCVSARVHVCTCMCVCACVYVYVCVLVLSSGMQGAYHADLYCPFHPHTGQYYLNTQQKGHTDTHTHERVGDLALMHRL